MAYSRNLRFRSSVILIKANRDTLSSDKLYPSLEVRLQFKTTLKDYCTVQLQDH